MTNARNTAQRFVSGPSRRPRTASTLRLRLLMEAQQKLEIAERITDLRKRSPYKQQLIADKLGITLRAYQKLEKVGTEQYERCEEIAQIHKDWSEVDSEWAHVSAGWIWDGRERSRSGDLSEALSQAEPASSGSVESMLREILDQQAALLADVSEVRSVQEHLLPLIERLGRGQEDTGS